MAKIKFFRKMLDEDLGHPEKIVLPDGKTVEWNEETQTCDLNCLEPYIGHEMDYYEDGVYKWSAKIAVIKPTKDGVNAVHVDINSMKKKD